MKLFTPLNGFRILSAVAFSVGAVSAAVDPATLLKDPTVKAAPRGY